MSVQKKILKPGNGVDRPQKGDNVTMEYTGWLYDANKPENDYKGNKFDSSVGRGDFEIQIGKGVVIQGWDQGILGSAGQEGMSLGEKSSLIISSDYAYGERGFLNLIPPNAPLIFDVELKKINNKSA